MYINFMNEENKNIYISHWLLLITFLVVLMIIIGGLTRLTDSGLSITEWEPVIGILPPFSLESWMFEFEKYKKIPEYTLINNQMSLSEFKVIYLWEWGHRFLARIVGLIALLPFVYFLISKKLSKSQLLKSFLIISSISLPNEVEISRQYLINQDIAKSLPLKDSFLLEGMLSFQACDASACIPIVQDLNHTIINDSNDS